MKNHLLSFSLLLLSSCATTMPAISQPSVYTSEIQSAPIIDTDAYNVALPSTDQVAIHMPSSDGGSGESITPLRTGQPAPYGGVLFNGPAVARISVEFRSQAAQCVIDRQADIDRIKALAVRDVGILNAAISAQTQEYNLMISSRDAEITRLFTYIKENNSPKLNPWPIVGATLGGIVLGGGIMTGILLTR
jgi:hypothetical protein